MNCSVIGHWEIGYMTPIIEAQFWSNVLRDFEVTEWWMNPVSGIRQPQKPTNLYERNGYREILEEIDSNLPRVFFEPRTKHSNPDTIWLQDFEHPNDCVYVFGSAHYNPTNHKRKQDFVVSIKTMKDLGALWSNQCLAMVLYDRMIKK